MQASISTSRLYSGPLRGSLRIKVELTFEPNDELRLLRTSDVVRHILGEEGIHQAKENLKKEPKDRAVGPVGRAAAAVMVEGVGVQL